jgi:6-phosphofructokinase 1
MSKKRIGILTGGGDVPPLNALIAASIEASGDRNVELIGFIKGWEGVVENRYVSLNGVRVDAAIGGTILKSSRIKLDAVDGRARLVEENLGRLGIAGLIVIGGEDTLSNCFSLAGLPQVLISKTIDNDVGMMPDDGRPIGQDEILNYFTLGFPTAARKISAFVSLREGLRSTAYSHERIIIVESMGMHAGWLALSSCLGRPDFIVIPEFLLDYKALASLVLERYKKQKHAIIVVAEGARFADGSHISADEHERDEFGHPRFNGAAEVLAGRLKKDLKSAFDTRNVNCVNPSYLYRSGSPCRLDAKWAARLGREAVRALADGLGEGRLFIGTKKTKRGFGLMHHRLAEAEPQRLHRFVDGRFYDAGGFCATDEARQYLQAIAEEIPVGDYGIPCCP